MILPRIVIHAVLLLALAGSGSTVTASEKTIRSLPVPVETIYPGQAITAGQLTARRFQTTAQSVNGIALDESQIIGKETRRRLVAGQPVSLASLTAPLAIRRGATAIASYNEDGFSISTPVTALRDGSAGDVIEARAAATGAIVKVQVAADGALSVVGP